MLRVLQFVWKEKTQTEQINLDQAFQPDMNVGSFCWLPPELMLRIFSMLNHTDLCMASQVDRYWQELSNSGSVWKHLYKKDFVPSLMPEQPAPFQSEMQHQHNELALYADFDKRVRGWLLHGFQWKIYYKERCKPLTHSLTLITFLCFWLSAKLSMVLCSGLHKGICIWCLPVWARRAFG